MYRFVLITSLFFTGLMAESVHAQDDYGNTPSTATPIAAGQTINGSIETVGDVDVFKFDIEPGFSYEFTGPASEFTLRLSTSAGAIRASHSAPLTVLGSASEILFVTVLRSSGTGNYSLIRSQADDAPSVGFGPTQTLSSQSPLLFSAQTLNDTDSFKVNATGVTGLAQIVGTREDGSGLPVSIALSDLNSNLLASGSRVYVDTKRADTFIVSTSCQPVGCSVSFQLVETPNNTAADDHPDELTQADHIQFGQRVSSKTDFICDNDPLILDNTWGKDLRLHGHGGTINVLDNDTSTVVPILLDIESCYGSTLYNSIPNSEIDKATWEEIFPDYPVAKRITIGRAYDIGHACDYSVGGKSIVFWPNGRQCVHLQTDGYVVDPPVPSDKLSFNTIVGDDYPDDRGAIGPILSLTAYGFIPLNDVVTGILESDSKLFELNQALANRLVTILM
jgi:hypothetical protein